MFASSRAHAKVLKNNTSTLTTTARIEHKNHYRLLPHDLLHDAAWLPPMPSAHGAPIARRPVAVRDVYLRVESRFDAIHCQMCWPWYIGSLRAT